jgi:hypothetical protein
MPRCRVIPGNRIGLGNGNGLRGTACFGVSFFSWDMISG